MEFTTGQIADLLGAEIIGDRSAKISNLAKIEEAQKGDIAFLSNPKYENYIYDTAASAVIVRTDIALKKSVSPALIKVSDPYSAFSILLDEYNKLANAGKIGIENPAHTGKNTIVGNDVYQGAFSYIGDNCRIGNNVKVFPQTYIGDNVTIGDNSVVYAGVKIYSNCKIGMECILHSGAVIGSDGFGFAPQADGSFKKVPQIGNVIIEDKVEIGANTTIDCATMGSTIIKEGAKIDNLVQIAHNVQVGEHSAIASQSGVAGSAKLGKYNILGGQVGIVGHIELADKTTVASQSGIPNTVKEPGKTFLGSPAQEIGDAKRSIILNRRLPSLVERIKKLEEKINNLAAAKKEA